MSIEITGVVPPVVTALHEDGSFDEASFARNVERQLVAGVHGLFVLGSSGEVVFCDDARRREILETTVRVVAGRVPVLAGVIDMQTTRVIEHVRVAEEVGCDAVVATAPFYALGGAANVERHFRLVAAATTLPVFAYDIPVCVHTKLEADMLVRLGREGVLAGVKDSSGDDVAFRRLLLANRAAGEPLALLTGHEMVVDGAYLGGAHGSVPGLANVDPAGYVRMWDAYQAGDWAAVRREQDRLTELCDIFFVTKGLAGFSAGVGAFKAALKLMGVFESNRMPDPAITMEGENLEAIAQVLRRHGLLD
ncbi:dihydrodipicolinate synthase family protein [Schaalia sp. 19OD2882]|uniref:dihydrodipicolinate synthase family protein n=1 Tax=Schaalia sp. 19OD2882 TaxID=2794089 RepID=UPI001C1EB74B|nr:dihydrodipicolinate synthase family protein [Schaalia sp. 19OD2882]QWW18769.1 dihydrodipicolinate synthase family protein [Schaalia sp. 19OD2882]